MYRKERSCRAPQFQGQGHSAQHALSRSLGLSKPAPAAPPTRRNLAFPGRGRHEWNSPEAGCTGYPATASFISLLLEGEEEATSGSAGQSQRSSHSISARQQMPEGYSGETLTPEPKGRILLDIDGDAHKLGIFHSNDK